MVYAWVMSRCSIGDEAIPAYFGGRRLGPRFSWCLVQGSRARVRVPALANEFPARVTRTSWALNPTSRTLMAQVELPNPQGTFLPGMYAYGSVLIERPNVRALPVSAVTQIGNQTYCYSGALDGKQPCADAGAGRGVSDGTWVEVTGETRPGRPGRPEGTWEAFNGAPSRSLPAELSLPQRCAPRGRRSRPRRDQAKVAGTPPLPPDRRPPHPRSSASAALP